MKIIGDGYGPPPPPPPSNILISPVGSWTDIIGDFTYYILVTLKKKLPLLSHSSRVLPILEASFSNHLLSGYLNLKIKQLYVPTPQNGQTHSNNLSAICRRIVWVCMIILWNWPLKDKVGYETLFRNWTPTCYFAYSACYFAYSAPVKPRTSAGKYEHKYICITTYSTVFTVIMLPILHWILQICSDF